MYYMSHVVCSMCALKREANWYLVSHMLSLQPIELTSCNLVIRVITDVVISWESTAKKKPFSKKKSLPCLSSRA